MNTGALIFFLNKIGAKKEDYIKKNGMIYMDGPVIL